MIKNQFGRRNLTPFVRGELVLLLEPLIAARAKANQIRKPKSVRQNSDEQKPISTKHELAQAANVSHDTMSKVKKLSEKAPEKLKAQLRSGDISINAAYRQITQNPLTAIQAKHHDKTAK